MTSIGIDVEQYREEINNYQGPEPEPEPRTGDGDPTSHSAFLLSGAVTFGPYYAPERLSVTKKRNLNRQENFCGGEDITDLGAKNRSAHVAGLILETELSAFNGVLDNDQAINMTTHGWSGQVMVKEGEYEGPVGRDAETGEYLYKYSLDVVSTGLDESDPENPIEQSVEEETSTIGVNP